MIKMVLVFFLAWAAVAGAWSGLRKLNGQEKLKLSVVLARSGIAAAIAAIILTVFVQLF